MGFLTLIWRKWPEHLKNNRPINAQLNFQEQKVTVFSGFFLFFPIFLISLILYIFFEFLGFFWEFPKSQGFSKIPGIFREWDPTLFGKNPMGFKIPGIGIFFRGIGNSHEKATSGSIPKLRAMAMRCFCPPESCWPFSPHWVANPSVIFVMNS